MSESVCRCDREESALFHYLLFRTDREVLGCGQSMIREADGQDNKDGKEINKK